MFFSPCDLHSFGKNHSCSCSFHTYFQNAAEHRDFGVSLLLQDCVIETSIVDPCAFTKSCVKATSNLYTASVILHPIIYDRTDKHAEGGFV